MAGKIKFGIANTIQAFLFGLLHGAMFISITGVVKAIIIIAFTAAIAWLMGYVNEKKSNGSIIPKSYFDKMLRRVA